MSSSIPEGWKVLDLEKIASVEWGNTSITKASYTSKGYPAFSASGNDGFLPEAEHSQRGIVLSAIGARCGKTFLTPKHWTAIKNTITIQCNSFDIDFLFQKLNFGEVWNKSGGAQPFISLGDARRTPLTHPSLPEQKKIASILTSVDEVIENTQRQIDKLQDLKKATINELLTKGIGHTEFKDSELGKIPMNWTVTKLEEFCTQVNEKYYGDKQIPVLSVTKYSGFVNSLEYFKKQVFSKDLTTYKLVSKGQFAYATIHLDEGSLGLLKKHDFGLISPMYTVFKTNDGINSDYLFMLMKSDIFMRKYQIIGQGSVDRRMSISFDNLSQLKFSFPTIIEQNEIVKIVSQIDKNINLLVKRFNQTQSLKKSLMQDLLTGKVRVRLN